MSLSCVTGLDVWNWLNGSQLVSTLIILIFGTFIFESWHKRKENEREVIWWLINHIEEYTALANSYWTEHPSKDAKHLACATRLKTEYSVLLSTVDDVNGISKKTKRQLREGITALYEAATGGDFETAKKPAPKDLTKTFSLLGSNSAALRRTLRTSVI